MSEALRTAAAPLLCLALWFGAGSAAAADVPMDMQALILARALAYDRDLPKRAGADVTIAVVYRTDNGTAVRNGNAAAAAFRKLVGKTIARLPVRVIEVKYSDARTVSDALKSDGVDAAYFVDGLQSDIGTLLDATRGRKVLSMVGARDLIDRGATLGVFFTGERPTVFVNLRGAREEGASFASELLKIAKVLR